MSKSGGLRGRVKTSIVRRMRPFVLQQPLLAPQATAVAA